MGPQTEIIIILLLKLNNWHGNWLFEEYIV